MSVGVAGSLVVHASRRARSPAIIIVILTVDVIFLDSVRLTRVAVLLCAVRVCSGQGLVVPRSRRCGSRITCVVTVSLAVVVPVVTVFETHYHQMEEQVV